MEDNLHEEQMAWLEDTEQANRDIIHKHELETTTAESIGIWFKKELEKRAATDD